MKDFPDAERTGWLHQMLSDEHLLVRNIARGMLYDVAGQQPALKEQMISLCAGSLQPDSKDWQGIEQSLVLLGQLRASAFSAQAVALLNYPRNEVMVSAAWLIHLFPDVAVRTGVLEAALDAEKRLYDAAERDREHGMKQAFLFEYLGIMRVKEIEETLAKQFSKGVPGVLERRSASMWALGLLYENNPDPALAARLTAVPMSQLCVSSITQGELLYGWARRPGATNLQIAVREFLARLDVLAWGGEAATQYGTLRATLEASGTPLGNLDMQIAAHALAMGAILVTNDQAFARVPALALENWVSL